MATTDPTKTGTEPTASVPVEIPAAILSAPATMDVDGMIAELEKVGIENPQDLSGKLEAGAQSGRLAQLLGDERQRSQGLEAQVAELQRQPAPQPQQDEFDTPAGQPIDLEAAIERGSTAAVRKELDRRDQATVQAHQQNLARWNHIQNDKRYPLVKKVWEAKLKDPNLVLQIQNGMVDVLQVYQETVLDYFEGVSKRSLDTIKQLHGSGGIKPPHLEDGSRVPTNIVSTTDDGTVPESVKKMKELQKKVDGGYLPSDEEQMELMDSLIFAPAAAPPVSK